MDISKCFISINLSERKGLVKAFQVKEDLLESE